MAPGVNLFIHVNDQIGKRRSVLEVRSVEEIMKEVVEGYNRRPKGWQIASDGRGNALVVGPDSGFRLKLMMVNPAESIGVGASIEDVDEIRRGMGIGTGAGAGTGAGLSCGFRPLSASTAQEIMESMKDASAVARGQEMVRRILATDPVPTWKLQEQGMGAVISGPYIAHPDLRMVSKGQSELDARLSAEVDRAFRAKYPMRASIYR